MDLSIRVIAFNTCATKVASHQGTHTYRLSKFLKINTASPKKRRQQQRSGIIQYPQKTVKKKNKSMTAIPSHAAGIGLGHRRRGAHYIDQTQMVNTPSRNIAGVPEASDVQATVTFANRRFPI